jgi:LysM repeat protein
MGQTMVRAFALLGAGLLLSAMAVACGGGGSGDTTTSISDPAEVPTSQPMSNPLTFRLKNDEIQINSPGVSGTQTGNGATEPQTHVIGEGENCDQIASQYGITVDDLKRANREINSDCTNLIAGEELRIPGAPAPTGTGTARPGGPQGTPTPTGSGQEYVIQDGDTCFDIAASFGVSVEDIVAANGLDPSCTGLFPGDVIRIP